MRYDASHPVSREAARIVRFILVGMFNTLLGYGFILAGLFLGAGDYLANVAGFALGMPIAYALHRRFTFKATVAPSRAEAMQFIAVFLVAYGTNLGVVAAGRAMGYVESPLVQLLAICTYAAVLYVLNRLIVFHEAGMAPDPRN